VLIYLAPAHAIARVKSSVAWAHWFLEGFGIGLQQSFMLPACTAICLLHAGHLL
jgi:hypothetical protein